jgi:serine/threonine protein kinase
MGEVYRATDTNLARQVAIKVLPAAVAADAERLARFDREAKTLAALNHPNVAAIYGLEKSAGTTALVMELVEGPTLADRIGRGAIPIDEALPIAKQIAEALEAAHEQDIIHRDLKPANIKVRPDSTVKVLDFGLAKATEPAGLSAVNLAGADDHDAGPPSRRLRRAGHDAGRDDPGHRRAHEPGAGRGDSGRSARRYLGLRRHPVGNAQRPASVRRRYGRAYARRRVAPLDRVRQVGRTGADQYPRVYIPQALEQPDSDVIHVRVG